MEDRKLFVLALTLLTLIFTSSAFSEIPKQKGLFLLTSHDPAFIKKVKNYVSLVSKKGRIILVSLKTEPSRIPKAIKRYLRPIDAKTIVNQRPALRDEVEAPEENILELIKNVKADQIKAFTKDISERESRSAGLLGRTANSGNKQAMDYIFDKLQGYGYTTSRHCYRDRSKDKECNIVGEKIGKSKNPKIMVVVAHMDSVRHDFAGADDNASGTAGLLEIARIVENVTFADTIRFVAVNGEEDGLVGSKAYVKYLKQNEELANVSYCINMDMIGFNKTDVVNLETDNSFLDYTNWVALMVKTYSRLTPHVNTPAWGSDHQSFTRANVPAYLSIEDWDNHNNCYHKSCDKVDIMAFDYAAEIVKFNLAVLVKKAGANL